MLQAPHPCITLVPGLRRPCHPRPHTHLQCHCPPRQALPPRGRPQHPRLMPPPPPLRHCCGAPGGLWVTPFACSRQRIRCTLPTAPLTLPMLSMPVTWLVVLTCRQASRVHFLSTPPFPRTQRHPGMGPCPGGRCSTCSSRHKMRYPSAKEVTYRASSLYPRQLQQPRHQQLRQQQQQEQHQHQQRRQFLAWSRPLP